MGAEVLHCRNDAALAAEDHHLLAADLATQRLAVDFIRGAGHVPGIARPGRDSAFGRDLGHSGFPESLGAQAEREGTGAALGSGEAEAGSIAIHSSKARVTASGASRGAMWPLSSKMT